MRGKGSSNLKFNGIKIIKIKTKIENLLSCKAYYNRRFYEPNRIS